MKVIKQRLAKTVVDQPIIDITLLTLSKLVNQFKANNEVEGKSLKTVTASALSNFVKADPSPG